MPHRDDLTALRQMRDFSELVLKHSEGKSLPDLTCDEVLIAAIVSWIGLIGEAATRVSRKTQLANPEIPWTDVIGTRNRLIHGYDEVNFDLLWDTIQVDIRPLTAAISRAIETYG